MSNGLGRWKKLLLVAVGALGFVMVGWSLLRPRSDAKEAAARISGLSVRDGRIVSARTQSSMWSSDFTEDAVLEFDRDEFNTLRDAAVGAHFVAPTVNDSNWQLIRSVVPEARAVLYRATRDPQSDSWSVAVLDLERNRLYASAVSRPR